MQASCLLPGVSQRERGPFPIMQPGEMTRTVGGEKLSLVPRPPGAPPVTLLYPIYAAEY
jgi:hypothetical protein